MTSRIFMSKGTVGGRFLFFVSPLFCFSLKREQGGGMD